MPYTLAPDMHYAVFVDRAILLDLRADRYHALGRRAADVLASLAQGKPVADTAALEALLAAGILRKTAGGRIDAIDHAMPRRAASECGPVSARPVSVLRVGSVLLSVLIRQSLFGLGASLDHLRRAKARRARFGDAIAPTVDMALAFARVRRALPVAQICLRDALTLDYLLLSEGLDATLVFGVRVDPFAAHAWLQVDDVVLTDACDIVCEFTPILTI